MNAWISSASPTATATVTTSSISDLTVDFGALVLESRGIRCSLEEAQPARRPVRHECPADDPALGHRPPVPAVFGVWPIVPHHVVLAAGNRDRAGKVAGAAAAAGDDVAVAL